MANEVWNSDLVDPFQNYSVLSLFPGTFSDSTDSLNPNDPNDIESIHSHLKSMALRSPNRLLDQAKIIVDSSSELMNSKFSSHVASNDENENVAAPQSRRPALGLKRPRFSWKPSSSQPTVSLEPTFDIDQLKDPVEYFLAYQKYENAKKELQRQRGGVLTDLDQNNPFATERRRQPGILRKPVRFKRRQWSVLSNNDETCKSQGTNEQDILSPSNSLQQEITDPNIPSPERELNGSIAKSEIKVNGLLDELLSHNLEDLDGDGALTLLQKHLQINPILPDKLCLPDLHDIRRNDFKAFGGDLPKPRNSLSDIHNMLKGISSKTPVKRRKEAESSIYPLASPTPPKSPFASISLLKRHILHSNSLHDPFSALNVDPSPCRNSSPVERTDIQSDQVDMDKELSFSGELKSLKPDENDSAIANTRSHEVVTGDSTRPFDKSANDNLGRLDVGIDVRSNGSHCDLEENVGRCNMDDNSSEPVTRTDVWTNGASELDDKVEDLVQEEVASAQSDLNVEDSTMEELNGSRNKLDQSSSATVEHHAMDGPSETPDIGPEHHIEKIQEPSRIIMNEQSKVETPPCQELDERGKAKMRPRKEHKREKLSQRQSLAGAGTFIQSGVRRSTRIKSRPLEYWKGERFLYGRIHQSLSTVIGVKYASPAKGNGKATLKVKSYVSDEYKELVELAALH